MTVLLTNNARSTLLSGINALQTEIRLRAGGGNTFPTITAPGQWFPITIEDSVGAIEIMRVIARSGDVFTVKRAQEGTTAKSFSANDVVELRLTVGAMQELVSDTHTNFGRIYMTPADGVDSKIGVPAGYYFNVRSPSDDSYVDEYQNVNGAAVATGKSYPSSAAVDAIASDVATLETAVIDPVTGKAVASKVYDASGKTQQEINDFGGAKWRDKPLGYELNARVILTNGDIVKSTIDGNANNPNLNMTGWLTVGNTGEVESVADLLAIQNPKNGSRVYVKSYHIGNNRGGGWFVYNPSKSSINDGVITFNGWVRVWDSKNIQPEWAGAKGDGLADDTIALQSALDFISSSAWDTSVAVMNQKGGGLNLVLSAKKYRITKTLWVGAYTTIRGSGMLGFNSAKSQETSSIIYADLDDVNTAAVSSSNWKTGGVRVPFNNTTSGSAYDYGLISATHGLKLYDFSIIASKKTHIGLRVQNSPQSRIEIYVHGFDYGVLMNASWQSYVNCRTLSYKCGLLLLNDNNGVKFDGYYNALGGDPLNYHNFINFFEGDTDIDSNWNDSKTKFGVVSRYSYGLCSDSTVAEHNSVGIVIASGDISIQTLYTEANSIVGLGCYTSAVTINDWVGYGDGYDMLIGANGKLYVNGITKDNLNTGIKGFSRWNSVLSMPMNYNYYVRGIKYHNTENVIYVSASGSDTNNGVYQPLLTLDEALNRIKNTHDQRDKAITTPNKQSWTIIIISEGVYPIIGNHTISCDLEIRSSLTNKPTITLEGGASNKLALSGSNFTITGCHLKKGSTTGTFENAIFWSTTGENTVSMVSGTLTLGEGSFVYPSWNGGSILNITLYDVNVVGSATTMLVSSNYQNASPHIVNFIYSQSSVDTNITGRADKGIAVPSTWQGKVLGF